MNDFSVFLFDIDGVLVAPLGYRAAVQAGLNYFFRDMKVSESLLPDEEIIAGFEAIRVTSEWDMVPICLAAVIDSWLAAHPESRLPAQLSGALQRIGQLTPSIWSPNPFSYKSIQRRLQDRILPGEYPADAALRIARSGEAPALFPHLAGSPLLAGILAYSRDLDRSITTRVFQHFTLGSVAYQTAYQRPPALQTDSLLAKFDRPLLPAELSQEVLSRRTQGEIYPAAFTMRPSLAPDGVETIQPHNYVPEAEIALALVQLTGISLIGYGRVLYQAGLLGLEPETLLKPSPFQAVAAIMAAISGNEKLALAEAFYVYANIKQDLVTIFKPGDHFQVHVFEDLAGGIEAGLRAAELLEAFGVSIRVIAYGIATHPDKLDALQRAGAEIYASTTQAVQTALASVVTQITDRDTG